MPFVSEFYAGFTPDEQKSEIVQKVGLIGQNTEKALLEDLNVYINSSTEILNFPEQRLRSWLSFFLRPVRHIVSAEGYATLRIPYNTDPNQGPLDNVEAVLPVKINTGDQIQTSSGKIYQVVSGFTITAFNEDYRFRVIQGLETSSSGTYRSLISISVSNIDLSSIIVNCADRDIQRAVLIRSQLIPYNGYYAFIHLNTLHVKIFKGPDTPDPEGSAYTITYRASDGLSGNITSVSGLQKFKSDLVDSASPAHKLKYTLTNEDILNGLDAPTRYELINELRSKFWITTNVASVPEYTAWFREQPEVGDVMVISDYERWRRSGKLQVNVTGVVSVYLMDKQGNPLTHSMQETLDDRLVSVRDIAILEYLNFTYVRHSFMITYTSASNAAIFTQTVAQIVQNFYNLPWLNERSMSLFEDLDVGRIFRAIPTEFAGYGIEIKPYHSKQFTFVAEDVVNDEQYPVGVEFHTSYYDGETFDGFYEWTTMLSDEETIKTIVLREQPSIDNSYAEIFQASPDVVPTWVKVGVRANGDCLINEMRDPENFEEFIAFRDGDTLKCFWPLANEGVASVNIADGARKLMDVRVTPYQGGR